MSGSEHTARRKRDQRQVLEAFKAISLEPTLALVERSAVHPALAAGLSDVPQLLGQLQNAQKLLGDLRG